MVETLFILILYLNGEAIEFMGHHDVRGQRQEMGMTGCLSMKRKLHRNGWRDSKVSGTRYSCDHSTGQRRSDHESPSGKSLSHFPNGDLAMRRGLMGSLSSG